MHGGRRVTVVRKDSYRPQRAVTGVGTQKSFVSEGPGLSSPLGARPPCSPRPSGAALALTEEGTRLADAHQGVSDQTWAQVRKHYDDDQTAALVCLVALINAANRLAVIVHQQGEPGMFTGMAS